MASSFANLGKNALLEWINETYQLPYVKIEQCASGALYCQILDSIYPGSVPLDKVNFDATLPHDFLRNYKVLQQYFDKLGINKAIDVDKLTKAKFQDNLEFLQWMRGLYDQRGGSEAYNAVARRHGKGNVQKPIVKATPTKPTSQQQQPTPVVSSKRPAGASPAAVKNAEIAEAEQRLSEVSQQVVDIKLEMSQLDNQRQNSFEYLRQIEQLCQGEFKDSPYAEKILQILYDNDGEDVIRPGEEDGEEYIEEYQPEYQPEEEEEQPQIESLLYNHDELIQEDINVNTQENKKEWQEEPVEAIEELEDPEQFTDNNQEYIFEHNEEAQIE